MPTYKQKFNMKYGQPKDQSNSLRKIAQLSGFREGGLRKIREKGEAAYFNNPSSVRPHVKNPTQWGIARVYSAVMGGKAAQVDKDLLKKR